MMLLDSPNDVGRNGGVKGNEPSPPLHSEGE